MHVIISPPPHTPKIIICFPIHPCIVKLSIYLSVSPYAQIKRIKRVFNVGFKEKNHCSRITQTKQLFFFRGELKSIQFRVIKLFCDLWQAVVFSRYCASSTNKTDCHIIAEIRAHQTRWSGRYSRPMSAEIALSWLQSEINVASFLFASRFFLANNLCFMVNLIDKAIVINVKIHKNVLLDCVIFFIIILTQLELFVAFSKVSNQLVKF